MTTPSPVQQTTYRRVPESVALAPLMPDEIRLQCGGNGWLGTFSLLTRSLAEDLLGDGEPFEATIVLRAEVRSGNLRDLPTDKVVVHGLVSSWSDAEIGFVDGTTIDLLDLDDDAIVAVTV